ncbi:MAG: hypothetical protein RBU37_21980 [Myxococcota bacterium]|jgi:hypothetical protein|nr:hypothetical protein [Myxococcota bacterium]
MLHRLLIVGAALCVFAFVSAPDEASAQFRIGPHIGYNFDGERLFAGADAWIGITSLAPTIELHGNVGASYYFVEDVTFFRFDVNLPFLFDVGTPIVKPYVAPGLALAYVSVDTPLGDISDTDVAANVIGGGLFLPDEMINPFAQLRISFGDWDDTFELMGGAMFKF